MTYFASGTSATARAESQLLASTEEDLTKLEESRARLVASGEDPENWRIPDPARHRQRRAEYEAGCAQEEVERQVTLDRLRDQVVTDGRAAWEQGARFFAPVLFQPLARTTGHWETALTEVTEIGWRLDAWDVIGPAPDPFGYTVTLIQTLFVRSA